MTLLRHVLLATLPSLIGPIRAQVVRIQTTLPRPHHRDQEFTEAREPTSDTVRSHMRSQRHHARPDFQENFKL